MKFYRKNEQHLIENYELAKVDNFKGWDIHHRLEFTVDGEYAHSREDLKRMNMYYDRPYFELIYIKHEEHTKLHKEGKNHPLYGKSGTMKGKHLSDETKKKLSCIMKGKNKGSSNGMYKRLTGTTWKVVNGKRIWYKKEAKSC